MHLQANKKTYLILGIGVLAVVLILWFANSHKSSCNVAYIKLHGEVVTYIPPPTDVATSTDYTYLSFPPFDATSTDTSDQTAPQDTSVAALDQTASEDVTQAIRQASANSNIKAIVLEIDSYGGSPVGGQEMELALKHAQKPTVALIRQSGDSAAYMAATGADIIYASVFSDVADIGITESYVDNAKQDVANGLTFDQLSIGKYKDMFNPDKPLTADERTLAMNELQIGYQNFVQIVAENRHMSIEKATALANGASMTGEEGVQAGLIDKIGDVDDVRSYLTGQLKQSAVICGIGD
jgi:signal peptide peptidase SppA